LKLRVEVAQEILQSWQPFALLPPAWPLALLLHAPLVRWQLSPVEVEARSKALQQEGTVVEAAMEEIGIALQEMWLL